MPEESDAEEMSIDRGQVIQNNPSLGRRSFNKYFQPYDEQLLKGNLICRSADVINF